MKQELVEMVISGEVVSARSRNMTLSGFFVSLFASVMLFLAYLITFCLLRKRLRPIYEPRTFVKSKGDYVRAVRQGVFSWLNPVFSTSSDEIMHTLGLDAYFFLRFLCFVMLLCGIIGVPFLLVLIPLHLKGSKEGVKALDRLSILSIAEDQKYFHIAHLLLCFTCMVGSMVIFNMELKNYFRIRAKHIVSRMGDDASGSSSTILVKQLDEKACNEAVIKRFFEGLSVTQASSASTVEKVWFNRDYSKLDQLVRKRKRVLNQLELNELWIIEKCNGILTGEDWHNGNKDSKITGNLWREHMSPDCLEEMYGKRGSHITWLKGELSRLNSEIYALQNTEDLSPVANSCFVKFRNNLSAFVASRSLIMSDSLGSSVKVYDKVFPADIIWSNLSSATWKRRACKSLSIIVNYLFIFGWAVPVALISIATQVDTMEKWMPQIHWAATSPRMSYVMTSVMTPIIVSSFTSMIPYFFRILARFKGFPTNTLVEMDVQNYLFLFMFFQLFLIVTISSGLPALLITTLVNTSEGAKTLANCLPQATTFFISYVLATSLTTAGNTLLQLQQLFFAVWYRVFSRTPREKFRTRYVPSTIFWGSVFPLATNVASIALAYALISPIILLSAVVGLAALYVAFKYRIVYCYIPRCVADGDYYPKAIFQLFAGFYCQQISLLGSLLVSGQITLASLAALIIVGTILSHRYLHSVVCDMRTRIPVREVDEEQHILPNFYSPCGSPSYYGTKQSKYAGSPKYPGDCTPEAASPRSILSDITVTDQRPLDHSPPRLGTPLSASPKTDSWKGLFDTMGLDFNSLSENQQRYISNSLFEHPDRWLERPCVWLPKDAKGIAHDQVQEMQLYFSDLRSSCEGAELEADGQVTVRRAPPDFDPREIMRM